MIEEYLDGTLSKEEREKLEDQLGKDKELADLLRMHADVNESISDNDLFALRKKIKRIGDTYLSSTDQISKRGKGKN